MLIFISVAQRAVRQPTRAHTDMALFFGALAWRPSRSARSCSGPTFSSLDMRMPVMDGWAVARALREQGINIPIVVMTAAESAKRWADEVGAEGYLAKPFGLDELLATVERFRKGGRAN